MTKAFRPLRSKIGVAFLALMLLFAQQLALAHMIGHLGESCRTTTESVPSANQADGDTATSKSQATSDLCSACVAFTGLGQSPISQVPPLPVDAAPSPMLMMTLAADMPHATPWRQLPRGPPAIL